MDTLWYSGLTMSEDKKNENFYNYYTQIRVLTDQDSLKDPDEEPYKSLYTARELLKLMLGQICEKDQVLEKICLDYQLAINYRSCNEKTDARKLLELCLATIEGFEDQNQVSFISNDGY